MLKYIDTIVHFKGFDDTIFYNELAAKVANEYGKANKVLCDEYENIDKIEDLGKFLKAKTYELKSYK